MAAESNGGNGMYEYGDLPPHPLVCGLAVGVDENGSLAEAIQAVAYSLDLGNSGGGAPTGASGPPAGGGAPPSEGGAPPTGGGAPPTGGGAPPTGGGAPPTGGGAPPAGGGAPPAGGGAPPTGGGGPPPNLWGALRSFPGPRRPPVVVFAGYLGPQRTDPYPDYPSNDKWRLLYQDAKAMSWLMVPEKAIVLFNRSRDNKAAFRLRDYIRVRADAPVRQGTEEESEQARFLVGTFTCASDLHDSLIEASTASAGSGILCAPTPECCPLHRTG